MPNGNSPSREAVQMPASATSKPGLGREVRAALLFKGPNALSVTRANYLGLANQTVGQLPRERR